MGQKILHMMVGLPRRGKSTIAKTFNCPVVEPDAIRKAIHGTAWREDSEPIVWGIAHTMVLSLFIAGHNEVVLDATNHTKARRVIWENEKWSIKHHVCNTSEDVCILRAIETNQEYLIPIIKRMASQFEPIGNCCDC